MFKLIAAVFIGGGTGSVLRFLLGEFFLKHFHINFPLTTIFVNVLGSLILGFLFFAFVGKLRINEALEFALTIGFCGGFTTFSTFSLELLHIIQQGEYGYGIVYALGSVLLCLAAAFTGAFCAKFV